MTKSIEIKNDKIDFQYLFRLTKIEIDKITLVRYDINIPTLSLTDENKSMISLMDKIGEETHVCRPEIVAELAGKVGLIIKGFEVKIYGKKVKKVMVDKIIYLE